MTRFPTNRSRRRGSVLVLTLLLVLPLLIVIACVIDYGYIVQVRAELQNAADAAAHAGAHKLFDRDELRGQPDQWDEIDAAHAAAATFAQKNKGGGVDLLLVPNESNDPAGDIVAGYLAYPRNRTSALTFNSSPAPVPLSPPYLFSSPSMPGLGLLWLPMVNNPKIPFITPPAVSSTYSSYNSVKARVRRDSTRNGSVNLYFGKVAGVTKLDLEATATATYEDNIRGFKIYPNGPKTSKLLPFAMDVNTFASMAAGMSVLDLFKYNPNGPATRPAYPGPPRTPPNYAGRISLADINVSGVLNDPRLNPLSTLFEPSATTLVEDLLPGDGIKEALLVPLAVPAQSLPLVGPVSIGNFGTLYLGNTAKNDFNEFARQVLYGPNQSDFDEMGGKLQLGSDGTLVLKGDGLIKMTVKELLQSIKGQPRVIPLYRPTSQTLSLSSLLTGILGEREYTIVGFGGVVILDILEIPETPPITNPLTGTVLIPGNEKSIKALIQPEFVIDGTAIGGGSTLANGGAKTSRFVYRPLALTR